MIQITLCSVLLAKGDGERNMETVTTTVTSLSGFRHYSDAGAPSINKIWLERNNF